MIVALGCWVGYSLVRQNGRILLRMQSLELQLAQMRLGFPAAPQAPPEVEIPPGLAVGSVAPSFELPDLRGKQKKLSQWSGRKILSIFSNPQCGFCARMAPDIGALPRKNLLPPVFALRAAPRGK